MKKTVKTLTTKPVKQSDPLYLNHHNPFTQFYIIPVLFITLILSILIWILDEILMMNGLWNLMGGIKWKKKLRNL